MFVKNKYLQAFWYFFFKIYAFRNFLLMTYYNLIYRRRKMIKINSYVHKIDFCIRLITYNNEKDFIWSRYAQGIFTKKKYFVYINISSSLFLYFIYFYTWMIWICSIINSLYKLLTVYTGERIGSYFSHSSYIIPYIYILSAT